MHRLLALLLIIIAPPAFAGWLATPSLDGHAPIASTFDPSLGLRAAPIPPDNGTDPVGAFRFICGAGHVAYDDPIVFPGQHGASHLHQFYGNDGVNAFSTYATLRASGSSTCNYGAYPLNRSAYWMPAMLDGKGHVVKPDFVSIYYKRLPATDPHCNDPSRTDLQAEGICVAIPNGLRMIWGYDMVTNTAPTGHFHFACVVGSNPVTDSKDLATALNGCPAGARLETMISAPECWDGKNLDSPNHRDHVSYPGYGSSGYLHCDTAHPYLMPTFTLGAFYAISSGDNLALWHFSSDEMRPTLPRGSTFHADYFEAWDKIAKAGWTKGCINTHLNCSGGNLGNGQQLLGAWSAQYGGVFTDVNPNRLVPVPPNNA